MATLNKTRNFYTISSNPDGIHYKQDGKFFLNNGEEFEVKKAVEVKQEPVNDGLDAMSWHKIKELVLDKGGVWTDKLSGVKFLRGE